MEIKFEKALKLVESGKARFDGTTRTEFNGYCGIITQHEACVTYHVIDISQEEEDQLTSAMEARV